MNALQKNEKISWLKSEVPQNTCRILSNARFLTEGVDIPDLDAVKFLKPRKSRIDIAQAVGRVMRKAEGKDYGYVILPIGIPVGVDAKLECWTKWLYYDKHIIERQRKWRNIFGESNKVILVPGSGSRRSFSCLMVDTIPDLNTRCRCSRFFIVQ